MSGNIKTLKDSNDAIVYPQTLSTAVYVPNAGKMLDAALEDKQNTITRSTSEPTSSDGVDGDFWAVYE